MKRYRISFAMLQATIWLLSVVLLANGYEINTHIATSRQSARFSILDQSLKESLGLTGGLTETINGKRIEDWIAEGSRLEDQGGLFGFRYRNHFHNPLRLWDDAGLRVTLPSPLDFLGVQIGQSSILWGQNLNQDPFPFSLGGGNWSWQNTRQRYFNALTETTKEQRDQAFADTFQGLGHLIHLVQDAASPAHTRNDAHFRYNYESLVLDLQREEPSFFQGLLSNPLGPSPGWEKLGPNPLAPVPIARLLDTERYRLSRIPEAGTNIGLAEYTNANFFSEDTTFNENLEPPQDFPFPARSSVQVGTHQIELLKDDGTRELVNRQYYDKVADGDTGYRLSTVGVLRDYLQRFGLDPDRFGDKPALDEGVYRDYASKLLPRAVGYSAGLLDYFFRGMLDVDLIPDPDSTDPTVVKLSGTNGSPDKLDGGTLSLYADDPVTGERSTVPALNPNFTVVAGPGQSVESAKFQINTEAERFMAVYKGKLGEEKPEGTFPGGVIGKAIGGVRAESIYHEGDKRMLRTVDGVFLLPSSVDGLEKIQWGDQDNTFAGIKSLTPGSSDQVIAFKINRPIGSPEKPPLEGPEGAEVVSAAILKAVNFPFDLPLKVNGVDVTVNYSQSIQFKQLLLTFDVIDDFVWNGSNYKLFRQVTSPSAELVVDQTVPFAQGFPIVLDRAHLCFSSCGFFGDSIFFVGPIIRPYVWRVKEVGFDAQGRLLALVAVNLTDPDNNVRTVNFRKRDITTGQLFESRFDGCGFDSSSRVVGSFQVGNPVLLALIDVGEGKVLGVTSSPTVSPSSEDAISRSILQRHQKTSFIGGGPAAGQILESWQSVCFVNGNSDFPTVETGSVAFPPSGLQSLTLSGRFRADLDALVTTPIEISTRTSEGTSVYFVDDSTNTNRAFRTANVSSTRTGTFTHFPQAQIIRPMTGASPESLLFFSQQAAPDFAEQGLLVRWSPQSPLDTALAFPERLPPAVFYDLWFTTSRAALLAGEACDFESCDLFTLLVDLAAKETQKFTGQFLGFDYVLLDPKFLYNINDTKFHTLDSSLRPTALPRALAPAPRTFFNTAYHLIQLQ